VLFACDESGCGIDQNVSAGDWLIGVLVNLFGWIAKPRLMKQPITILYHFVS